MKITFRENVFVLEDFLSTVKNRAIENKPFLGGTARKVFTRTIAYLFCSIQNKILGNLGKFEYFLPEKNSFINKKKTYQCLGV